MFNVPERYRNLRGTFATTKEDGNMGMFIIPHQKIKQYFFRVIASSGFGWEHISITLFSPVRKIERCPTWEEMCFIKDLFWDKTDCAVQYHPAEEDYISNHPYCLHIWRPTNEKLPVPPSDMVGLKALNR